MLKRPILAALLLAGAAGTAKTAGPAPVLDISFQNGQPVPQVWGSEGLNPKTTAQAICVDVPAGGSPWDRMIGINGLQLRGGQTYRLSIGLESSTAVTVPVLVQVDAPPYQAHGRLDAHVEANKPGSFSTNFVAQDSRPTQFVLHLGGAAADYSLCLTQASIVSVVPKSGRKVVSTVVVNQSGYGRGAPKRATFIGGDETPVDFSLIDAAGKTLLTARSKPLGYDASAGAPVHVLDFSSVENTGQDFRLKVGTTESDPFPMGQDVFAALRIDALSWFYPQRSGIAINGRIAGAGYARAAGHIGVAPNRGDTDVACLKGKVAQTLYPGWSCSYRLDVSGGWYDAGDQGKYAVTGAISAAQLMAAFERGAHFAGGSSPVFSDSLSRSPENGNGVPDLLDEARWELEFLLKMMVPDGQPLAGMVHHKVHDTRWTAVPMLPAADPMERALHRPSTAATLAVAAAAAQGARLFGAYDAAFAARLSQAAQKAWKAAGANPVLYAPVSDGQQGGGDYDDDDIEDETYWAAAELYLTTGTPAFLDRLKRSPHWNDDVFFRSNTAFDWRSTAGLGRVQLALFGKNLPAADQAQVQASVVAAADRFLALQAEEGFGQIYRPGDGKYDWGSNQMMLQNMVVVAAAYDVTGRQSYRDAAREGMDYLLGRNAMNLSYITGYGTRFSRNQHSRWYANQVDPSLPHPPAGTLAGGPNSTLVDELARAKLKNCAPQLCYLDDINAWGSNEMAINWNAPLVYMASFLADAR
ncbi:endoglucanase [Rhizobium rhizosphaerae]|uniref:Endoglucanase n=1 Tax=Xaviernesmea rhizosphaerae TaxID=1672749 RepID=A0A1Q9AP81_9HYPH|nr:glycoside hydrolase family 9 protein [Xaviernesmea rhizosphaerae]OLP57237.1 endoglucanase [Xaviernesmea rhizosphaerae]